MLEVLSELFCPPYDVVQLLLILLLLLFVIYTCLMISLLFRRFYADHKTSRFFSQHKVTSGAVIKYEVSDGNIYTTASQAVPGYLQFLFHAYTKPQASFQSFWNAMTEVHLSMQGMKSRVKTLRRTKREKIFKFSSIGSR